METKKSVFKEQFKNHPRVSVAVAPHAPYTVEGKILSEMADFAKSESLF